MTKRIRLSIFIGCIATITSIDIPNAQARQCRAAPPANQHGYWSYRLIDGRKCWYEGEPMLSKSLLEWRAPVQPAWRAVLPVFDAEPVRESRDKPGNPLDAKAWAQDDFDTFEARWRAIDTTH
jgi:hypothetical protein